jgi:hypothetical protein
MRCLIALPLVLIASRLVVLTVLLLLLTVLPLEIDVDADVCSIANIFVGDHA